MSARRGWATGVVIAMVVSVLGAPAQAAPEASPDDPFAGVGTSVSVSMDTWDHPRQHVRRMHQRGVTATIRFRSSSGRRFDGFALDTAAPVAAASLRAAGQEPDAEPVPTPLTVTLSSDHDAFSPNGDGRNDSVTLTARSSRRATIRLEVRDSAGEVVRRWAAVEDTTTLRIPWSGRGGGERLADGRYAIRATAVADDGGTGTARQPLRMDTRPPSLRLHRLPRPFDAAQPLTVRYAAWGGPRGVNLRLQLRDLGLIRAKKTQRPSGSGTVEIRSRYGDGDRLLPGEYQVSLTAADPAGNRTSSQRRLVVIRATRAKIFERVETRQRKVALTFDDCHLTDGWASILTTLKRHSVTATFFCPGDRLELYPELGRRTVAEGHVPASHGWDHRMMTQLSYSGVKRRLQKDQAAWARLGGTAVPYFRPPYGDVDSMVVAAAGAAGYPRVMLWDVDPQDYTSLNREQLICNATCKAKPGSVILLHTNDRTAAALPGILAALKKRNLEPVGLPELFRSAGHQ